MLADGDLHSLWNAFDYFYLTQEIQNQGTVGGSGNNTITDTPVLTGAEATFPRALKYALEGGPTAAGVVSAYISTVSAPPILVPNDGSTASTITVTLTDSAGNPVAGKVVSLASDGDATITDVGGPVTDVNGQVTFTVQSDTVGTEIFTASDETGTPPPASIPVTQTAQVVFTEVSPTPGDLGVVSGSAFDTWAGTGTLGAVTFEGDTNGDGVQDGLSFLLGVANPDDDANGSLPVISEDGSGNLIMEFDCLPSADRGTAELRVAHSDTLASFTATVDQVPDATDPTPDNGVTFVVVGGSPTNEVTATIGSAAASGGKLFGRLEATE